MRFVLFGSATSEFVIDAPNQEAAEQAWLEFHRRHPRGRRGPMRVLFHRDTPVIIDQNGRQCPPVERTTCRQPTTPGV